MTDLIPAARPVPSPEDRMRDARTDREYADRIPAPRPLTTDRTNSHHRDLHQHIAGLEADLRSQTRAVLEVTAERDRHRQELGAAGEVLAVVRDAVERIDRALAVYGTTPEGTTTATADEVEFGCPRLAAVLDGRVNGVHSAATCGSCAELRNGRATPPSSVPPRRAQEPQPGQFCAKHFSWLCQAGQGRCQAEARL